MQDRPPRQQGFSLIEMLFVIVIIAILATIAIPMYVSESDRARDATVKAGVHGILVGVRTYAIDNGDLYPDVADVDAGGAVGALVAKWPANPWTSAPMVSSDAYSRGDFSYRTWSLAAPGEPWSNDRCSLTGWISTPGQPFLLVPPPLGRGD